MLSEEPGKLEDYFAEYFDKILIDAPCSGEAMSGKDKKMVKAWEEHGPEFFANIQKSIITQAGAENVKTWWYAQLPVPLMAGRMKGQLNIY